MPDVNKAILIGRVGQDPEVREAGEHLVANLSLATSKKITRQGQKEEVTTWHRVTFWNKLAEIVEKYVKKGMLIYAEGEIVTRQYEKDGEKRYATEIVCNQMQMLSSSDDQGGQQRQSRQQSRSDQGGRTRSRDQGQRQNNDAFPDEDIPF